MTAKDKRAVALAVLGGLLLATIVGAASVVKSQVADAFADKESVAAHRQDMQAVGGQITRVLDLLCSDSIHRNARQCHEDP